MDAYSIYWECVNLNIVLLHFYATLTNYHMKSFDLSSQCSSTEIVWNYACFLIFYVFNTDSQNIYITRFLAGGGHQIMVIILKAASMNQTVQWLFMDAVLWSQLNLSANHSVPFSNHVNYFIEICFNSDVKSTMVIPWPIWRCAIYPLQWFYM